ncbi:cyclin-b1-2 [Quercus suber]|uniref:Cyclin-b1-2 n=1 Tax=Quercus suber TaxID=58331 RepID=A0AAW0KIN4_QUESU
MEATKTIAHEIGGIQNDALRFGLHGVKSDIVGSHPLESAYQSRPPGAISSSMLGLEALTGSLDEFGFEDYLNDPKDSEALRPLDTHHGMEVRLGLSKGPICPSFI